MERVIPTEKCSVAIKNLNICLKGYDNTAMGFPGTFLNALGSIFIYFGSPNGQVVEFILGLRG